MARASATRIKTRTYSGPPMIKEQKFQRIDLTNHVAEFCVRANKFTSLKNGLDDDESIDSKHTALIFVKSHAFFIHNMISFI